MADHMTANKGRAKARRLAIRFAVIAVCVFIVLRYGFLTAKLAVGSAYVMKRIGTASLSVNGNQDVLPLFKPVFPRNKSANPCALVVLNDKKEERSLSGAIVVSAFPLGIRSPGFSAESFTRLPFGFALAAETALLGVGYGDGKTETRLEVEQNGSKAVFTCYDMWDDRKLFVLEVEDNYLERLK